MSLVFRALKKNVAKITKVILFTTNALRILVNKLSKFL